MIFFSADSNSSPHFRLLAANGRVVVFNDVQVCYMESEFMPVTVVEKHTGVHRMLNLNEGGNH